VAKKEKKEKSVSFMCQTGPAGSIVHAVGRKKKKIDALREKKTKITCSTYFTSIFSIRAVLNRERESIPALL